MKRISLSAALLGLAGLFAMPGAATAHSLGATTGPKASRIHGVVTGGAYALYASMTAAGATSITGPLGSVWNTCGAGNGRSANSLAHARVPSVVNSGGAQDSVVTKRTASGRSVKAVSVIHHVKLLGGLVTASEIRSVAHTKSAGGVISTSFNGTELANLTVNGTAVSTVTPNQRIDIANLGYVILDQQMVTKTRTGRQATVIGIHLYVTTSNAKLGVNAGSQVIVALATTGFLRSHGNFVVGANSYGLYGYSTGSNATVFSGPIAYAVLSCVGGRSRVSAQRINDAALGSAGTVVDAVYGKVTAKKAGSTAWSKIQNVNLMKGLVKARVIQVKTHVSLTKKAGKGYDKMTFTKLRVAGTKIPANVSPNTRVTLPGVGYADINVRSKSVLKGTYSRLIDGIVIRVNRKNSFGLPVGAIIVVAHASAQAGPM